MAEGSERLHLRRKPRDSLVALVRRGGGRDGQLLDGDELVVDMGITGKEDLAHPASAQGPLNHVASSLERHTRPKGAGQRGHGSGRFLVRRRGRLVPSVASSGASIRYTASIRGVVSAAA